jgi:hypothetical protein
VGAETVEVLEAKVAQLRAALGGTADMRPGSLVERYRSCGKPGCRCAKQGARGHGPSWSLTREVAGKTVTKVIPPGAVEQVRAQIEEHRRFRAIMRELVETSERLCDTRLAQTDAASQEAAKKGASKRPSRQRSSGRSTPS